MSVIAEFSIPAEQFELGQLLEVREGVQVRLESMVPTGGSVIPYFWVESPDIEDVELALSNSSLVDNAKVVDRVEDEALFRVDWSENVNGIIEAIGSTDAVILGGNGHGDHWSFQLRFGDSEDMSRFYRTVIDKGIIADLVSVYNPLDTHTAQGTKLTDEQREALLIALEEGYFAIPREITLVELAEKLGISDSAVSQRIRRGLRKLLISGLRRE